MQRSDEASRLVASDGPKRSHHSGAEQLVDADFPHLFPVVAVRGEGHVEVVVPHDLDGDAQWPVGEVGVVVFEHFFRDFRRRDDDGRGLAELEVHDGAVSLG